MVRGGWGSTHPSWSEHMVGFALIKTIVGNKDMLLKKSSLNEEIKKCMPVRTIQKQSGYPPDKKFKQIMSIKSPTKLSHNRQ